MLTAEKVRAALENLRPTQEKVDQAVRATIEIAQPSRIILFGSWARGEARWDSDVDMAVVLPDFAEPRLWEIRRAIRQQLEQIPMTIDLVMATESHFKTFGRSAGSIYHRILHDGIVAYEQRAA